MIGTWRCNLAAASVGGFITFLLSVTQNILLTTFLRTLYSFGILFVLAYGFRWVLGTLAGIKSIPEDGGSASGEASPGTYIDLLTPEESGDSANGRPEAAEEGKDHSGFAPLSPPRLASRSKLASETLAKAVRQMADEEGR
jgi:hypothetical protein